MTNKIFCATRYGIGAKIVEVEATFNRGLPSFNITGLANSSIQEAKHRVQSALLNNSFSLPPLKIVVNLSPSDLPKTGSHFDLPIALLSAIGKNQSETSKWFAFGELGLDGQTKHLDSIYPLLLEISIQMPNSNILLPSGGEEVFSLIPNLNLFFVKSIKEAIDTINTQNPIPHTSTTLPYNYIEINENKYYYTKNFELDFAQVKGQEIAKKAALISASGFHNLILEGSPGSGKSMIAKRLRYILPPLCLDEMMECAKLQALDKNQLSYTPLRGFRNPHQSSSKSSILGSATMLETKPGEVALANNGILFFDELPHFKKEILESMREPLENNVLCISRVHAKVEYQTKFLFIGAQNPCPCGNLLSHTKECRCQDKEIKSYKNRISEPFWDRIDLFVQMNENSPDAKSDLSSEQMHEMVLKAFSLQKQRGQSNLNGKLDDKEIEQFCILDSEAQNLANMATSRLGLTQRGVQRLKKVARTIADLQNSDLIKKPHILEAISYRKI